MNTIKRELRETLLVYALVVGLFCAAFLGGALVHFATTGATAVS